ncbi:MAG TPA: metal ABC transporter permease, partial [Symbiobacteriaceae bacterium]|nr:metal ABC transporter permease [Symbiobacteriaceae bacterium]
WVLTGSMLLGLSSGVLGSFALLKRRSLMGDALAHAALPGVCIVFLLTGVKSIGLFLIGAAVAGLLGTMAISAITRFSKIKEDTALGLVLTVFFGIGIMLLTVIQRMPGGNQSGLDKFLFGQAASLVGSDVQIMVVIAGVLCLVVWAMFKEFKLLAFDPGFGAGLGVPMGLLDLLLNLLILLAVVIGLQSVGVVLMAAMLITPAISARYWTDRLSVMVVLSGMFGAASGALGTLLSQLGPRMPTGPLIVLAATAVFAVSLLAAPRRGMIARFVRFLRLRRQVAREGALRSVYELTEEAGRPDAVVTLEMLRKFKGLTGRGLPGVLAALVRERLMAPAGGGWMLSPDGVRVAHSLVREQRLWEVFLMHEGELGGETVDRDGGGERFPSALRGELERLLRLHNLEPRIKPIAVAREGR